MKTPLVLLTLLAGSILAIPAWAGTPSSPEVTDASGDAPGSVDVLSSWITTTASEVTITLKIRDLASEPDPVFDNEGSFHNHYRAEFRLSSTGATHFVEAQISMIESQSAIGQNTPHYGATVTTHVGTHYTAGRVGPGSTPAGQLTVDAANNLIIFKLTRDASLAPGTVISGLTVKTYQNPTPHEMENNLSPIAGGNRIQKDATALGRSLTI